MIPDDVRERVTGYIRHQATKSRESILDLVRTSQQRYLDAISGADEQQAAKKPGPEDWSLRELVRHVISAQGAVVDLVHHLSRGSMPPQQEGPRGIGMQIEDDGRPFAAYIDELRQVNARLIDAIAQAPEEPDLELKASHPFFGPLNSMEWAVFQRVHDEDHVQHAQKILAAI